MQNNSKLQSIKDQLKKLNIWPNKRLGQNFLVSEKILKNIVGEANLSSQDIILEVGPGLGILTDELKFKVKQVVAIEKDRKLAGYLLKKYKNTNVKIVNADVLEYDLSRFEGSYKIVANLPYQISSVFINKIITSKNQPTMMMLMLQKEVAQRIAAKAGNAKRGILSVLAQLVADIEIVEYVQKQNFYPMPDVDSAVVRFAFHNNKYSKYIDNKSFSRLVKIGFSQKRRQIHHPLSAGLQINNASIKQWLEENGIDPSNRAEDLTNDDWIGLLKTIDGVKDNH